MNDREEWRERVRDIRATSTIWWWGWWIFFTKMWILIQFSKIRTLGALCKDENISPNKSKMETLDRIMRTLVLFTKMRMLLSSEMWEHEFSLQRWGCFYLLRSENMSSLYKDEDAFIFWDLRTWVLFTKMRMLLSSEMWEHEFSFQRWGCFYLLRCENMSSLFKDEDAFIFWDMRTWVLFTKMRMLLSSEMWEHEFSFQRWGRLFSSKKPTKQNKTKKQKNTKSFLKDE